MLILVFLLAATGVLLWWRHPSGMVGVWLDFDTSIIQPWPSTNKPHLGPMEGGCDSFFLHALKCPNKSFHLRPPFGDFPVPPESQRALMLFEAR